MSINYSFLYITIKRASNFLFDTGAANNCEIKKMKLSPSDLLDIGNTRNDTDREQFRTL